VQPITADVLVAAGDVRPSAGGASSAEGGLYPASGPAMAASGPAGAASSPTAAAELPIARVAVDTPLPHLDRLFDYLVPESLADTARTGCRVKVRFSGRITDGYLAERAQTSDHAGQLAFLHKVVSPEPVLTPDLAVLARLVADRYGGTLADVLRLAIPPRHATAEKKHSDPSKGSPSAGPSEAGSCLWSRYPAGPSFLSAVKAGRAPRAVWGALPGPTWPAEIAAAAAAAKAGGRGALIVVPDAKDLARIDVALAAEFGAGGYVTLAANFGPAERYRRWLSVSRQQVNVVAGTRAAMFAPVADLGLVVIWDDGDDLHSDPHAPYPHARDVLLIRAHQSGAAALIGGFARTAESAQLVATGWARPLAAGRPAVRQHAPMIKAAGDDGEMERDAAARLARMPGLALRTASAGLATGPVLFQVPRRGYLAAVACRRCGERIRCARCAGPVALSGPDQPLACGWCGTVLEVTCVTCGNAGLRALVTGARRTAEELSRAFPGVTVHTSSGTEVLTSVPAEPGLVIATPGAEPPADGGYSAAVLLDGWALLGRPSLRAAEEALRRWLNAAALVKPGPAGGKVIVLADVMVGAVQALIRWDPVAHADRELAERTELSFPPAVRMAAVTGTAEAVQTMLSTVALPASAQVLGPVPVPHIGPDADPANVRFLVRVPSAAGTKLALALRSGLAERSARKEQGAVRVQLDPAELI
jgi:primosomal protein N' (replication factor Y) (superfamily II helicase)